MKIYLIITSDVSTKLRQWILRLFSLTFTMCFSMDIKKTEYRSTFVLLQNNDFNINLVSYLRHSFKLCNPKNFFKVCFTTTNYDNFNQQFCKKVILNNFVKFTGKHLCHSIFLNKVADLRPASFLKRYSGTGAFLWILRNFKNTLFYSFFYTTPPVAASVQTNLFEKFKSLCDALLRVSF